ncbi:hypothetical protein E4H04_11245 [Candidatus Bathyarchaeota archaeon]|nr:MAG: hypothetical protein E4H04_11245 [Candidatus Bathyarchaeota archaeon]
MTSDWYYDFKKSMIILLLVVGITFGSSTASLILIPLFFLFAYIKRNYASAVYGLIPLTYVVYIGGPYASALGFYSNFAYRGLMDFMSSFLLGTISDRVLPWNRVSSTTLTDTYIATLTYFSLLLLAGIIIFIGLTEWLKERNIFVEEPRKAVYRSNLITLTVMFVIFGLVYIGASVQPETSFSDIRTIVIVVMTLLIPYILSSDEIQKTLNKHSIITAALIVLIVFASARTFYETYPKGINDPINVLEDRRLDGIQIIGTRDFISNYMIKGEISYDFKTDLTIPHYLFSGEFTAHLMTDEIPQNSLMVYDLQGIKYPSLHTDQELYAKALSLTDQNDVIYNNGSIIIQDTK